MEVSSGKWAIGTDESDGGLIQILKWWHVEGEQTIKITGVKAAVALGTGQEQEGIYDQCQPAASKCDVM